MGQDRQRGYMSCEELGLDELSSVVHARSDGDATTLSFAFGIILSYCEVHQLGYVGAMILMLGALDHFVSVTEGVDVQATMTEALAEAEADTPATEKSN